jgi:hypothetical protein
MPDLPRDGSPSMACWTPPRYSERGRAICVNTARCRSRHHSRSVTPHRTALLVYDMQVGIAGQVSGADEIVARIARLVVDVRKAGMRIAFCRHLSLPAWESPRCAWARRGSRHMIRLRWRPGSCAAARRPRSSLALPAAIAGKARARSGQDLDVGFRRNLPGDRAGYPSSETLAALRRRALDNMRVRHQQLSPSKFIIYSEWAGGGALGSRVSTAMETL